MAVLDICVRLSSFPFEGGKLQCNLVVEQVGGVPAADGTVWRSWAILSEEFRTSTHINLCHTTMIVLVGYGEVHPLQEGGTHAKLTEACAELQVCKVKLAHCWWAYVSDVLCYNYNRFKTTFDSSSDSDLRKTITQGCIHCHVIWWGF